MFWVLGFAVLVGVAAAPLKERGMGVTYTGMSLR